MFLSRNKKNNVYPCEPQFYYIKVGFKGVNIIKACFRDDEKIQLVNSNERRSNKFPFPNRVITVFNRIYQTQL